MTKRRDLEADVSGGGQEWHEPEIVGHVASIIRDVYAPIRGPHLDLDRAIREVSEAEIRGAFIGREEALKRGG